MSQWVAKSSPLTLWRCLEDLLTYPPPTRVLDASGAAWALEGRPMPTRDRWNGHTEGATAALGGITSTPPTQQMSKPTTCPSGQSREQVKHVPPPAVGGGGGCGPNHFLSSIVTDTVAVTVTKAVSKTVSAGACNCTYSRNCNRVCN